jgi:hypothetical protein
MFTKHLQFGTDALVPSDAMPEPLPLHPTMQQQEHGSMWQPASLQVTHTPKPPQSAMCCDAC